MKVLMTRTGVTLHPETVADEIYLEREVGGGGEGTQVTRIRPTDPKDLGWGHLMITHTKRDVE